MHTGALLLYTSDLRMNWHREDEATLHATACLYKTFMYDSLTLPPNAWLSVSLSTLIKYAITTICLSRRIRARDVTYTYVQMLYGLHTHVRTRARTHVYNPFDYSPVFPAVSLSHSLSLFLSAFLLTKYISFLCTYISNIIIKLISTIIQERG